MGMDLMIKESSCPSVFPPHLHAVTHKFLSGKEKVKFGQGQGREKGETKVWEDIKPDSVGRHCCRRAIIHLGALSPAHSSDL